MRRRLKERGLDQRLQGFGRFLRKTQDLQRFFVVGRGKSGTTWMTRMLRLHPDAMVKGERKVFERNDDYEPPLRHFLETETMAHWHQYSSFRNTVSEARLGIELARVAYDYLQFLETPRPVGTHIGDKIPFTRVEDAELVLTSLPALFPGCRVLHLVRDGRDVAVSSAFHAYRTAKAEQVTTPTTRAIDARLAGKPTRIFTDDQIRDQAESWARVSSCIDELGPQNFGERYRVVRYEDMLADTAASLKAMYQFLGLRVDSDILDRVLSETSFEAMTHGRSRGQEDPTSFVRKGVSGDWLNYFTAQDTAVFIEAAGSALVRFGYLSPA